MTDPNLPPEHGTPPSGPPSGPTGPYGSPPPPGGYGAPPPGQQSWGAPPPGQQFAQPAAQPYLGGYHGPDWIPEIGRQVGSVGARIGAKAIDIVFYVVIQIVVGLGAIALVFASSDVENSLTDGGGFAWSSGDDFVAALAISLIGLVIDFLYNVVMVARFGGQPGKLLVGLRVVRTDGRPADMGAAFRRWSPILALSVLGLVPIAGFFSGFARFGLLVANLIMVCVDGRRRSVFDHVGSTYVVTAR